MPLTFKEIVPIVQPDLEKSYFASSSGIAKVRIGAELKPAPNLNQSFELESGSEKEWVNFNRKSVVVDKEQWAFADDILSLSAGKQTDRFYHIDDETFRFDVVYGDDPTPIGEDFHTEAWEVKSSIGLKWCYQDTLENDYLQSSDGTITLEEYLATHSRPINIVGSYAVYGTYRNCVKTATGETIYNGSTGKLFHFYRPKLIDSLGTERWCELYFDEVTSELRIKCDFRGLIFPVVLDPDVGYTSVGASSDGTDVGWRINSLDSSGANFSTGANADKLISCSLYTAQEGPYEWNKPIELGLYDYNGLDDPEDLLESVVKGSGWSNNDWTDVSMAGTLSLSSNTDYCPCAAINGVVGKGNMRYDSEASANQFWNNSTATLPNPYVDTGTSSATLVSLYFTYSESGVGLSIPVAMYNRQQQ